MPSLATTVAAIAFALRLGLTLADQRVWAIAAVTLLSQLSISALNDWADRERDGRTARDRPIPIGLIDARLAFALAVLLGITSLAAGLRFGASATIALVIGLAAGWSYDLWLKPSPFGFVPFAIAFPLLPTWVGLIFGRPLASFGWLLLAGAWLGVGIHLADSLPDLDLDRQAGVRSLAVVLGARGTVAAIIGCLTVASVLAGIATRSSPGVAGLLVVAGASASVLVMAVGRRRPALVRWIAAAFGIGAALALLPSATSG